MKKKAITLLSVLGVSLALAAVIALPLLVNAKALTFAKSIGYIGLLFYVFANLGMIFFSHKIFDGKAQEIVYILCSMILISFFLAVVAFAMIQNGFKVSNFDWMGALERILHWDIKFLGIQFLIFVAFGAIYLGFIDRNIWKFMRYTGIGGKGKLKQMNANLENSRWLNDQEKNRIFKPYKYSQLGLVKKDGVPVMAKFNAKKNDIEVLFNSPCHALVIGSTGSGKTTTFVSPMIQLLGASGAGSSMIITDPKGELFSLHSAFLAERGYDVKVIDLRDTYASYRWNPLDSIWDRYQEYADAQNNVYQHEDSVRTAGVAYGDPEDTFKEGEIWYSFDGKAYSSMKNLKTAIKVFKKKAYDEVYEDLNDLASALVPVENERDPMWEKGARAITLATLLAMLEDSEDSRLGMVKEKFNFFNLAKILQNSNKDYYELRRYFSGRSPLSKALSLSKQVCDAAESTRASYMSIVYEKLTMFNDSGICSLTSNSDFVPENLVEKPTALFLKIPDEKDTRYNLAAIFMMSIYKALIKIASASEELSLPRNVYYIMDEFANMPRIDKFDKMITVGRSRKIWFNMIIQSYAQLNNVYGDKIADIVKGNCGIKMFIGSNDMGTCKEFSELCGNITVATNSSSGSANSSRDVNVTTQMQVRPLIYPSELQRLNHPGDIGHSIVVTFGNYPLMTYFTPSFQVPMYKTGKMDTTELENRLFDERKVYYDVVRRNDIIEKDYEEKEEASDASNGSGGVYVLQVDQPKEPEPTTEKTAVPQEKAAEEDARDVQDLLRRWKMYKQSHPDAKPEDLLSSDPTPKEGR